MSKYLLLKPGQVRLSFVCPACQQVATVDLHQLFREEGWDTLGCGHCDADIRFKEAHIVVKDADEKDS